MSRLKQAESRHSKPLPTIKTTLDSLSRKHASSLLIHWLEELDIPAYWHQILLDTVVYKLFETFKLHQLTKQTNPIYIQFISSNSPKDSKFLKSVYHGDLIHFDDLSLYFPVGGTIRFYGVKENMTAAFREITRSLLYLTYCLYLETEFMLDSHVLLIYNDPVEQTTESDQHHKHTSIFNWIKKFRGSGTAVGQELKRRFSLDKGSKDTSCINDSNKFVRLKEGIDQALISTSPGCKFSCPRILDRLVREQEELTNKTKMSKRMLQNTRRRSSLLSLWRSEPSEVAMVPDIGLDHLSLDTTSLTSFKQHQRLVVTFSCSSDDDHLCMGPVLYQFNYFNTQSDHTLEHILSEWHAKRDTLCHKCKQIPFRDHKCSFAHGNGNVTVSFQSEQLQKKDRWMSWTFCPSCKRGQEPTELSHEALMLSFAKFLELLFYDTRLICACQARPYRYFHMNGLTTQFGYQPGNYYELRLPGLQMMSVAHVAQYDMDEPRLRVATLNSWKRELATHDVGVFFEATLTHLDLLSHYIQAEHRRRQRDAMQMASDSLEQDIQTLQKQIEKDEQDMLRMLRETKVNELNDFRRYFGVQSQLILENLAQWQKEKCKEVIDDCGWDKPDYIRDASVHSFPGSAVLVREDEPTSVIAYTLSSNEYVQELMQEGQSSNKSGMVTPNVAFLSTPGAQLPVTGKNSQVLDSDREIVNNEQTKELMATFSVGNKKGHNGSLHIQHKFVHNDVEFTCIVYYANEFEMLRRQCGVHQIMIESLCRCQSWVASGGKSKSRFYKTQDDRFVVKEMMNVWNVSEKDAFLNFAPKYFNHMKKSRQSALAKIFGFFTIEIKKKESSLYLDVLVMEHLFYNQHITKKFDFKGIVERHVGEYQKEQKDITLWDGDWLNEYKTKLLVQNKSLFDDTIANDAEFLSQCNIMDYSLLVGVNEEKREIMIGIVDFIGAYTWYKKIESKGKSTIKRVVTIVPPGEYKTRFCKEILNNYFVPVQGKFDMSVKTLLSDKLTPC
ncbi:unnamed protein product [Rhizopus microsporus]